MIRRTLHSTPNRLLPLLAAALVAFVAACRTDEPPPPAEEPVETVNEFEQGPAPTDTGRVVSSSFAIAPVYFDLDRSTIRSEFQAVLQDAAETLRSTGRAVTIEGHCDERGSDEYNIALGDRRATSVRAYLYNLGVPNGQMEVVSYGESRPAVNGRGETAWQLNRRAQFVVR